MHLKSGILVHLLALPGARAANLFGRDDASNHGSVKVGEVKCILHRIEPLMINATDDDIGTTTVCIMDAQYEEGNLGGIAYTLDEGTLPYGWAKDVEWSETVLTISKASVARSRGKHGGGVISVKPGASVSKEKKKHPQGNLRGKDQSLFGDRYLAQKTGESTLIVLYAIPPDASNHKTSSQLANDVFGINTNEAQDTSNVRTQMAACSRGQLTYIPACGTVEQACFGKTPIVNGVLEVPITQSVTGVASGDVVNYVTAQAQIILNGTGVAYGSFTQTMVVIPDAASWGGAAAWAYLPGTLSAFRSSYSTTMGVQMHEFGHNLGLHHSGYNGASYADYSCLMGSPSYGDDGPVLCWNAAKSWVIGWYASDSVTVDPSAGAVNYFTLVGVADWANNIYTPGQHKVVLEIQDSSQTQDFYVIYNRAKGPNAGVTFAKDQVTISTGYGTEVSWHQAGLGAPNPSANEFPVFRKPKYNGGTKDLVVKVCDIATGIQGSSPDTAKVLIYLDDGPGLNNGPMCPGEMGCLTDSDCDDGNWCTKNSCNLASNICNTPVDISASRCPTCGDVTYCNPNGYCRDICDDKQVCSYDYCDSLGVCQHDPIPGCAPQGALLETWLNIGGSAVSDLTGSTAYQTNPPDEVAILESSLKAPVDRNSNFGSRLRTFLRPSVTGTYTFYIASDDSSELWLSPNENPANKAIIASVSGWTAPEQWTKFASQKSSPIALQAGKVYFVETFYKEGGGGDNLAIGWESADASIPLSVIDGSQFFIEAPIPCSADSECNTWLTNPCDRAYCNFETTLCEFAQVVGCENGALLETWNAIGGASVDSLLLDARFPEAPSNVQTLTDVLEAPTNIADNFGSRLQTFLMPPRTCDYTFYIASDDTGRLNLSNDTDPANKKLIAWVDGWTSSRQWDKYASQKSAPVHLVRGQVYYLEALYKEGGGGDNLAIAWECIAYDMPLDVIGASHTAVSFVAPQPTSSPTTLLSPPPTSAPTTSQPTVPPTSKPTLPPTTSKPTVSPTTSAPTVRPTTSKPTAPPTTLKPTFPPTTSNPTAPPTTSKPTAPPTTFMPSFSPTTSKPTTSPTTFQPTVGPTTSVPTVNPTTSKPTALSTTLTPTVAPTSSPPSVHPTTSSPTTHPTTPMPSGPPTSIPTPKPTVFVLCGTPGSSCTSNSQCCSNSCGRIRNKCR